MAAFLFRGDDVFKPIESLSGGERAKLSLLKLMLSGANLLLLDEPTNHLDIPSREALEDALSEYEGTLFIISHDRYFINKLATRVLELQPGGMMSFPGNYDAYQQARRSSSPLPDAADPAPEPKPLNDYRAEKERKAEWRRMLGKLKRTEEAIAQREEEIAGLEKQLCAPEISSDYVKAMELGAQLEELRASLDGLYGEWAELQEKVEEGQKDEALS